MAFILVAVSSDGRLFNAIIRRSIVSQPFFHPSSSTRSIFSTLGLVRHCFFSAVSIRGVYTSVPTDRYGMKSGRRWEGEREFGWPLERADSFPPEFTRHRLTVKRITEIVFEIFLLLSFSPFSFSRVLKAFPPRGTFHAVVDHRALTTSLRFQRYRGQIGKDPRESDVPRPKITPTWGDKWNSSGWLLFT